MELPISKIDLKTTKRLPPSLRGTIYESMLEAVSEELAVWRESIKFQKTSFYEIDLMDNDRLLEICNMFGVPFITLVKDDLLYLREEVRAIPFKIYYKGTPTLYKSFITAVDRYGEMFIYIYRADGNNVVRLTVPPFNDASLTHPYLPFKHRSLNDFSGNIQYYLKLDDDRFLDAADAIWKLDTKLSEISSNHVGLEYFIDRIIKRDGNEYLMTSEYLNYLSQSLEFGRRAKEVPHIGSQLSIQTDVSGLSDSYQKNSTGFCSCSKASSKGLCKFSQTDASEHCKFYKKIESDEDENASDNMLCKFYSPPSEYTIPSLKLKAVTRPDFFDVVTVRQDITTVEFGIKQHKIASLKNPKIPFPSDLKSCVCSFPVLFYNYLNDEDTKYKGAMGEYLGQSIKNIKIPLTSGSFDGKNQYFEFKLPHAPIRSGSVSLEFILPSGEKLLITDNKKGLLISANGFGKINYETGDCELSTIFTHTQTDIVDVPTPPGLPDPTAGRKHFKYILKCNNSVIENSVWLTFTSGKDTNQRTYTIQDDGEGNFIYKLTDLEFKLIDSASINYKTREINIVFKESLVNPSIRPFTCRYSFEVDYKLPAKTELIASCYAQKPILITEAGFKDSEGQLLTYATFPPFEFSSMAHHLSFMVLVKKPD